jgi:hypothetical protein
MLPAALKQSPVGRSVSMARDQVVISFFFPLCVCVWALRRRVRYSVRDGSMMHALANRLQFTHVSDGVVTDLFNA